MRSQTQRNRNPRREPSRVETNNRQNTALKKGQNPLDMGIMETPHNQQNRLPAPCHCRITTGSRINITDCIVGHLSATGYVGGTNGTQIGSFQRTKTTGNSCRFFLREGLVEIFRKILNVILACHNKSAKDRISARPPAPNKSQSSSQSAANASQMNHIDAKWRDIEAKQIFIERWQSQEQLHGLAT
ncbi:MAG: hypothetical protein FJ077_08910 [Cyanobacteria bacterium K_DeepCast_35m_m2_023]|nr:hypothetical protein [Cyanobacteria bacterium K_DeepCast_35m_m2_023]